MRPQVLTTGSVVMTFKIFRSLAATLLVILGSTYSVPSFANDISFPYSGRLVHDDGKPVDGPVDVVVEFYSADRGNDIIAGPYVFSKLALESGVFQLSISMQSVEFERLTSSVTGLGYIQIIDATNGVTYPRQRLAASPFAFKVPVDNDTIGWNDNGQLVLKKTFDADKVGGHVVETSGATPGQVLTWDADANKWKPAALPDGGSQGTSGIDDGAITTAKIAEGAVTSSKIADAAVTLQQLADNSVDAAKLKHNCATGEVLTFAANGTDFICKPYGDLKDGGNSTGQPVTVGTTDTQPLTLKTDNSARLTVAATGEIGIGTPTPGAALDVAAASGIRAQQICDETGSNCKDISGGWGGDGTVTSVGMSATTGLSVTGGPVTSAGTFSLGLTNDLAAVEGISGTGIAVRTGIDTWGTITDNSANWDLAYTDRLKWDGGATGLDASAGRTSLGLQIGSDVQAYDAQLTDIAGLAPTADSFIMGDGTNFGLVTGSAARTALGAAASGANSDITSLTNLDNDSISGNIISGGTIDTFASTGIDDNADSLAVTIDSDEQVGIGTPTPGAALDVAGASGIRAEQICDEAGSNCKDISGGWGGDGTVTSVGMSAAAGLSVTGGPVTSAGTFSLGLTNDLAAVEAITGTGIPVRTGIDTWGTITDNSANWDLAHTDRLKWDGGATGLDTAAGRMSLGLQIGTDVQAYDAQLDNIAGLTPTADNFIMGDGTNFGLVTGSAARTALGAAASGANNDITSLINLDNDSISGNIISGGTINAFASTGIDDNADSLAVTIDSDEQVGIGTPTPGAALDVAGASGIRAQQICDEAGSNCKDISGGWGGDGTVTSIAMSTATGLSVTGGPVTSSGTFSLGLTNDLAAVEAITGTGIPVRTGIDTWGTITNNSVNWDLAHTDRLKWDGGATGLDSAAGRMSLGLQIGSDVQAYDAQLDDIAGLTPTADNFIMGDGTNFGLVADSAARTALSAAASGANGDITSLTNLDDDSISGDVISGGTIDTFASTGIDDNADSLAVTIDSDEQVGIGTSTPGAALDVAAASGIRAQQICDESGANCKDISTGWGGDGTVTSVAMSTATGLNVTGGPVTSAGTFSLGLTNDLAAVEGISGTGITVRTGVDTWSTITDNSTNWDLAHTDRLKWDGSDTGLDAAAGRTSLGLQIGSDVQAYDEQLTDIAGLTPTSDNFIMGDGTNFGLVTGSAARTALGAAASGANNDITSLTNLNNDSISGNIVSGGTIDTFASTGIDDNADILAVTIDSDEQVGIGTPTPGAALDVAGASGIRAQQICDESGANCKDISTGWGGDGTVTSVAMTAATGLSVTGGPITGDGTFSLGLTNDLAAVEGISGTGITVRTGIDTWNTITDNSANWDLAHTDRLKWDGGPTGLDAAAGRMNLGLQIGTDVQAYDDQLADIAGLTPTADNFIMGDGTNFGLVTGSAARTALGAAASGANSDITSFTNLDNDSISGDIVSGGTIDTFASTGIDDNADSLAVTIDSNEQVGIGTPTPGAALDVAGVSGIRAQQICDEAGSNCKDISGGWGGDGTVTSVGITTATGLSVSGGPVTGDGTFTLGLSNDLAAVEAISGTGIPVRTGVDTWGTITDNSADWDLAHTDRLKWDGGATGLDVTAGRTNLGLQIGTDVQAYDAKLASLAAMSASSDSFIVGNGTTFVERSAAWSRGALGAAKIGVNSDITRLNSLQDNSLSGNLVSGGTIDTFASTGIDDNAATTAVTINASGQLGIGTTSPNSALEVAGMVHSTAGGFKLPDGTVIDDASDIGGSTTSALIEGWPDAVYCNTSVSGNTYRTPHFLATQVTSSNQVTYRYIGTATSYHVQFYLSTGAYKSQGGWSSNDCIGKSISTLISEGKAKYFGNDIATVTSDDDDDTKIMVEKTTDEDAIRFDTAGSEKMVIDATGKVGIGITATSHNLQVNSTDDARVAITSSNVDGHAGLQLDNDAQKYLIQVQGSANDELIIHDSTADVTRVVMDKTGQFGIGGSPSAKFHVRGQAGVDGIMYPDGSLQTKAATFRSFGTYAAKTVGTVYQAATDGYIVATIEPNASPSVSYIYAYIGATNNPTERMGTTSAVNVSGTDWPQRNMINIPVPKGSYWKVELEIEYGNAGVVSLHWMPINE